MSELESESELIISKEDELKIKESVIILVGQIQEEIDQFENAEKLYKTNKLKQVEFDIQINRVIQILDGLIIKIKLVFSLPIIIKDEAILEKYLNIEEINKITEAINEHQGTNCPDNEYNLIEALYLIFKSPLIVEIPNFIDQISSVGKEFLKLIEELKRIAKLRMKMTAPKEMAKEKLLHKMWRNNEKTKEKIKYFKEKLSMEQINQENNLTDKYKTIEQLQDEINVLRKQNQMEVEKQISESNTEMIEICQASDEIQTKLKIKLSTLTAEYNQILDTNLKKEGKIRDHKTKVQQQLKSWLTKYDMDIGDRTKEQNELKIHLDETTKKFNDWHVEFKRQEDEYKALMAEKLAEEKRKQEEKLLLFMMNRAAITIQRAFRRVLAKKKKQKKKGKKGKK